MNQTALTTWETFKGQLAAHPDLTLQFQYGEGQWVDASYHITEIKQAQVVSVDCGGQMNTWTEIIVQLWEPPLQDSERAMQVNKALSIVKVVENALPLHPLGIVKVEFGNAQFDTRQMYPKDFSIDGENMIVNLIADFTQCKAIGRGGSCGTTEVGEECCTSVEKAEKPEISIVNLAANSQLCEPGSGCC